MPPARHTTTLERLAPWLAGLLLALPVLVARYPPMVDLPLHEAVVGLLRHWGDAHFAPPSVYELRLGYANQLVYFLALPLAYAMPVGAAMKLVAAGAVLFFPVAVGRLADHLGVTRFAAALVAPLGLAWMFFWGLLANMIGLDLYLALLPALDAFCQRPTRRGLAVACAIMVLLYFAHGLVALVGAGTLVFLAAASRDRRRSLAWAALPATVGAGLAIASATLSIHVTSRAHEAYGSVEWMPLGYKIATLPSVLFAGAGSEWQIRYVLLAAFATPAVLFAVERWHGRTPRARTPAEWLHDFRFEALGAALALAYLVAPVNVKGTTLIYHRFAFPAAVLLALGACSRKASEEPWRLPRLLAALVPLAPLLASWPRFVDSNRMYRDLDAAIAHMDTGSRYLVVHIGPSKAYWLDSPGAASGHVVAALGGRGSVDATTSESSPVFQRVGAQWDAIYERVSHAPTQLLPAYDLTRYRYLVVHSSDVDLAAVSVMALAPEAKLVFHEGEWTVLESTLPLVPIDAPDEPTPSPAPRAFGDRLLETLARVEKLPPAARALPF